MAKRSKTFFLKAPEGVTVHRHHIGGDNHEIRFTVKADGFDKLVGISYGERFVWLHKDFCG